jgi:tetratricopeptide (TPR) repeat protein
VFPRTLNNICRAQVKIRILFTFYMKTFSKGSHTFRTVLIIGLAGGYPLLAPLAGQEVPETETVAPLPLKSFRFTTRDKAMVPPPIEGGNTAPPPNPVEAASPAPGAPAASPPLPEVSGSMMQIGRVTELETLPPALAEVAREGALAVADGNWERARTIYLQMVKEAPGSALAYANLGVTEHQLGNLLAASGNLGKSLELNPHIARNWQTLGLIEYQRGELELAISHLTRAIHEAPADAESRLLLAAVVRDYGWVEAAVTELQRAVEIDPKLALAHYNLAVTYLGMKPPRIELARRHYYAAIDLGTPETPEIEAFFKKSE